MGNKMDLNSILLKIKPYSSLNMSLEFHDDTNVIFGISLEENINDKNTMFAGSIYSSMVLCGWTLAYKIINNINMEYDVVISNSSVDYIRPVRTDAKVRSASEGPVHVKQNNNKSVHIKAELFDNENLLCAEFNGEFIGIKNQ